MINELLKPETELEHLILSDPEFIQGALWGEPRRGHPEGKVAFHIREVLDNVDKFSNKFDRKSLRLIAIIHDTFKHKVDRDKPRVGENHHAMIARRFAEKYITDKEILDIIELHDEAYNAWCAGNRRGDWRYAQRRTKSLIDRLGDSLDLFLVFYKCDGQTGDKVNTDYDWFLEQI